MKGAEQVRVFLTGRQVDAAGEESRIALSVKGRRFLRGESRYVSYDDTELIEGEMIPTMLRVGTSEVTQRRCPPYTEICRGTGAPKQLPYAVWYHRAHNGDAPSACAHASGWHRGGVYFLHALCGRCAPKR